MALLAAAHFSGVTPLHAQAIPGRVFDDLSGRPLATVSVMLLDSAGTAIDWAESDSLGFFVVEPRRAGPYRVYANALGYEELLSAAFSLEDLGPTELEVRLLPQPMELEGVVVSAERRRMRLEREGFYRRQRGAVGYFLDAEDIADVQPTRTTNLLRRLPGVQIRPSRWGDVALNPRHYGPCPMKVVLDGFKLDLEDSALDNWVDPDRIIGVEVYPNRGIGAPIQHRGTDAFCGVIMIWTR